MQLFIILLIAGILIYVYFHVKTLNSNVKSMLESGEIINREGGFYEKAYIFTLRPLTSAEINNEFKETHFTVSVSGKTNDIRFSGSDFKARLWVTDQSEDHCIYRFEVTSWNNTNGIPKSETVILINQLLTSVEKILLNLDPNTQVRSEEVARKTSIGFF